MRESSTPGAPAYKGTIPLSVPEIGGNEWKYIKECLDTNWISSVGAYVDRFEKALADYVGTRHAVAVVNGTAALHVALLVAGVEPDDEVLVPTLTFVAPANAVRYVGAWPVFMDSEPVYYQMDPDKLARFLHEECRWREGRLENRATGRQVKAVLPVHVLGHPCDMGPIAELARKYELPIIEDATESLGATCDGEMVGCLGDIACFSFNGNKVITTGGGGMIVTDREDWATRAHYLTTQAKDDPVEYVHNEIGYNYRLTNIQAAMGVAQMERLDEFISKKRLIADTYNQAFKDIEGVTTMAARPGTEPTYWLYTILLHESTTLLQRKAAIQKLNDQGVGSRPLWHPIHALPPFQECQSYKIEQSDGIYRRGISLPSSVGLQLHDQEACIQLVKRGLLA